MEKVSGKKTRPAVTLAKAPLPEGSPAFFRDAMTRARRKNRPLVIDFWAEWCVPCIKLKKQTLQDETVAKSLSGFELVYVDLDKHPGLAKVYGVSAIPDVFFVDREGYVYDRLRSFEEPEAFLPRLHAEETRRLTDISDNDLALAKTFNAVKGKTRMLLILSPG